MFLHFFITKLQLEKRDLVASQTLRAALQKAEQSNPGLTYELVRGIISEFWNLLLFHSFILSLAVYIDGIWLVIGALVMTHYGIFLFC